MPHFTKPIWKYCGNRPAIKTWKMKRSRAPDSPRYFVWLLTPRHRRVTADQSQASTRKIDDIPLMCIDFGWYFRRFVSCQKIKYDNIDYFFQKCCRDRYRLVFRLRKRFICVSCKKYFSHQKYFEFPWFSWFFQACRPPKSGISAGEASKSVIFQWYLHEKIMKIMKHQNIFLWKNISCN